MRIGIVVMCAALATATAGRAESEIKTSATDQKAIGKLATDWTEAWNRHDAEGMARVFSEKADLINPMGDVAKGHQQILKLFTDEQAGRLKQSKMALTCEPARLLAASVAQVDCDFVLEGLTGPQAPPVSRGHQTSVAVRDGERWSIVTMRAMIPRQPDAPAATPVAASPR